MTLVVADGHEVSGELAMVDRLVIDSGELPEAHAIVLRLPNKIKGKLKVHGAFRLVRSGPIGSRNIGLSS